MLPINDHKFGGSKQKMLIISEFYILVCGYHVPGLSIQHRTGMISVSVETMVLI